MSNIITNRDILVNKDLIEHVLNHQWVDSHNPQFEPSDNHVTVQVLTNDYDIDEENYYPYNETYVGENFGCTRFINK